MDKTRKVDNTLDAIDRNALGFGEGGYWYQAHRDFLGDVAMVQRTWCLDAVISRLIMHGFIQVFTGSVIS